MKIIFLIIFTYFLLYENIHIFKKRDNIASWKHMPRQRDRLLKYGTSGHPRFMYILYIYLYTLFLKIHKFQFYLCYVITQIICCIVYTYSKMFIIVVIGIPLIYHFILVTHRLIDLYVRSLY